MPRGKKWEPTDEDKKKVRTLIGFGLTCEQVAVVMEVSRDTLYKRCKKEIDAGRPSAIAQVTQAAFKMAMSGKNTAMTIFWLKTQAQWKEPESNRGDEDHGSLDELINVLKQGKNKKQGDK
jgi:hypothetical protein